MGCTSTADTPMLILFFLSTMLSGKGGNPRIPAFVKFRKIQLTTEY